MIWPLRVMWAVLPLVSGPLAANALDGWSTAPRLLGGVMAWGVWAVVVVCTLSPSPAGLTVLRLGATAALVGALAATPSSTAPHALGGIIAAALVLAVAMTPAVGEWCVNGRAYGDEQRFLLRPPPTLVLGPLPLAIASVAAAPTGALFLANGQLTPGLALLALGVPVGIFATRSLHALSRRWAVLVPAGLVIADPMTLTDPILFPRERIEQLAPTTILRADDEQTSDLRLGAFGGSLCLEVTDPATVSLIDPRHRRARGGRSVDVKRLLVAPTRPARLLDAAASRQIPVGP